MTRAGKAANSRIWEDARAWKIVGVFVLAGPTCAFIAATIYGWIISQGISFQGFVWYPFIYLYLGIPSLLMGIVAAFSFHMYGQVFLAPILAGALLVSAVLFAIQGKVSFDNYGALLNHIEFITLAGLGSWMFVSRMRKHAA